MTEPYSDPAWDDLRAENERLRTETAKANRHFGAAFNTMQARIAALEAERDRLRALVADTKMSVHNLVGAIDEWQLAHMTGDEDLAHQKGEAVLHRRSLLRAWLNARATLKGGSDD